MMAEKARLFGDEQILAKILSASSPGLAKSLGRQVNGFIPHIWDEHCSNIVIRDNFAKFSQNPKLTDFILSTKQRILVEASPVDKIWGIGLSQDDSNICFNECSPTITRKIMNYLYESYWIRSNIQLLNIAS